MRVFIAVLLCKLSRFMLRLLKRGGTNLPGKIAVRICPDLLRTLARGMQCVVITGTNGKTTSARIIEQAYIDAGADYFANRSGANLLAGITAEFAMHSTLFGKPKCRYAVIECDEAASARVCEYINPAVLLVTNIFRDQLDRFGEITHTLQSVAAGAKNSPNAVVCLNADDSLSVSIEGEIPQEPYYYGVETAIYKDTPEELSDAAYCIRCKSEYEYDYRTYAHLGGFRCPECGYTRPDTSVAVIKAELDTDGSSIEMRLNGQELAAFVNLPGGYNIYNAAGAGAALSSLGFSNQAIADALAGFECGFGRMEKFELEGHGVRMILVKNPAGFNQVLNYLSGLGSGALLAICLNDRVADGTDISWIWDVNFERLADLGHRILVSGVRADDMALRLKYAGIPGESVAVIYDYVELLREMLSQPEPVFVMPTYTAMLELREIISNKYGYKDFWE